MVQRSSFGGPGSRTAAEGARRNAHSVGVTTKTTIPWEKRSARLWVAHDEKTGRRFRIERNGNSYGGTGTVVTIETDDKYRELRKEPAPTANIGKQLVEKWLAEES